LKFITWHYDRAGYSAADSSLFAIIGNDALKPYYNIQPGASPTYYRAWQNPNNGHQVNPNNRPSMANRVCFIYQPDIIKDLTDDGDFLALGQVYGTTNFLSRAKARASLMAYTSKGIIIYVPFMKFTDQTESNPQVYTGPTC
jgi:hypothetical protein